MAGRLLGGLEVYDTATQARDSVGGPLVNGLSNGAGPRRPIFDVNNSRAGLLTSERVDTQRIPVTQTVLAEPVLNGRQASYRERDLLFVVNAKRGLHATNERHSVYNLQALNEVLEQRARLSGNVPALLRGMDAAEARTAGGKLQRTEDAQTVRRHLGSTLSSMPRDVREFVERVGWLGTMGGDDRMDGGAVAFAGGHTGSSSLHPLTGQSFRAIAVNVKAFAEIPPVFLSCDPLKPEETMPHAGAQVGLLVRHVFPNFYQRFHRYEAAEQSGAPTPVPFLQVLPVWRSGGFPHVVPRRAGVPNNNRYTVADIEDLSQNYYLRQEVEVQPADGGATQKVEIDTYEHGQYYWLGTVEAAHGEAPTREEQKLAIRSRQHYDQVAASGMLYVHLNATVGLPVPFAGY